MKAGSASVFFDGKGACFECVLDASGNEFGKVPS